MAGARAAGARIVGKANLFELAYGASGVNEWFGTPTNPLDPALVPGGSSSGSAVAVADGDAEIAYGSDTGGSIRIPSAFCGTVGLKTTFGRIPLDGVWPLAVSLDTVGPMARDVAGVTRGMALLEPGFAAADTAAGRSGGCACPAWRSTRRSTPPSTGSWPPPRWRSSSSSCRSGRRRSAGARPILAAEAVASNRALLDDPVRRSQLGAMVAARFRAEAGLTADDVRTARAFRIEWQRPARRAARARRAAGPADRGVLPAPARRGRQHPLHRADEPDQPGRAAGAGPPRPDRRTAARPGIQLVGPWDGEELVLATGTIVESAAATLC